MMFRNGMTAVESLSCSRRRRRSMGAPLAVVVLFLGVLGCESAAQQEGSVLEVSAMRHLDEDVVTCGEIQCFNGGSCVMDDEGAPSRCACPEGAEDCQAELSECGKSTGLYCRNGSQCTKTRDEETGVKVHFCNCTASASDAEAFAGDACQFRATSYCVGDADEEVPQWTSFCTNFGTCKGRVGLFDAHPGCTCPDGYGGDFCEVEGGGAEEVDELNEVEVDEPVLPLLPKQEAETVTSGPSVMQKVFFVFVAALLVAVIGVLAVKTVRRMQRENEERRLVESANYVTSELAFTGRDDDDDDDEHSLGPDKNKRGKQRTKAAKAYKAVTETDDVAVEPLDENEII